MDITDTKYLDFLKIYFKDVADLIDTYKNMSPHGNTPEELQKSTDEIAEKLKAALNKPECVSLYHDYEKIPEGIRDRYVGTKVPPDIMEAAKRDEVDTLRMMELHPEIRRVEDAREAVRQRFEVPENDSSGIESGAAMALFATAIAAGYSQTAGQDLAMQRQYRDGLLEEKAAILENPNLSDAQKKEKLDEWFKKWLESRKATIKTIEDDWRGNPAENKAPHQPEKYLVHLLGKFNRETIKEEKDKMLHIITDHLMPAIHNNGRHEELLNYLKQGRIQAKIGHFKDETRDILAGLVLQHLPEAEREQYLARDFRRNRNLSEDLSDDRKAAAVARDMKSAQANAIPENSTLTSAQRRENSRRRRRTVDT